MQSLLCCEHILDSLLWVQGGLWHGDNSAACTMGPLGK